MAKLKLYTVTGSRTSNYEKVEIQLTFEVEEGDKVAKIYADASKVLDNLLEKDYQKMLERQEKQKDALKEAAEKAKAEKDALMASLPKNEEEASEVVYEGAKLSELSLAKLKEIAKANELTPHCVGAKILLGESSPTTSTSKTSTTAKNMDMNEILDTYIPRFVSNSKGVTYGKATKSQLQFIIKAEKGTPEEKEWARLVIEHRSL